MIIDFQVSLKRIQVYLLTDEINETIFLKNKEIGETNSVEIKNDATVSDLHTLVKGHKEFPPFLVLLFGRLEMKKEKKLSKYELSDGDVIKAKNSRD